MMRRLFITAIALALGACGPHLAQYRDYRGDGTFVPHAAPAWICPDGYTVDLGVIDLTRTDESTHRLEGLPAVEATIGLAMVSKAGAGTEPPRLDAAIALTLLDDKGAIVLSRHERLSEWTRSFALNDPAHTYLFQRGTQIDVAVTPATVRAERFPIGPDDSWGTYFTPRRGARYTLHFAVEQPDPNLAGVVARLQIHGAVGCP